MNQLNEWLRRILFLPPQMSTIARDIDSLHYFVIISTMIGATVVTLVGGYYLIRYRERPEAVGKPNPDASAKPMAVSKVVALILLAVLFLWFWVIGIREYVRLRVAPEDSLPIYVTAKQWMWKFAYPQGARSIDRLYVPAGRPVKLIMTSRDVIHSLFIPSFRVKQDVVPGRYVTMWFQAVAPGTYPILCTQYCGTGHSTMRAEVVALRPEEYQRWLDGEQEPEGPPLAGPVYVPPQLGLSGVAPGQLTSMARLGVRVAAEKGCLRCHTLDGTPHLGPTWAGLYGSSVPLADGSEVVADVAYLTESMMDPSVKIHAGYLPIMPSFVGRLGAGEVAALVELIKSLRNVETKPRPAVPPAEAPPEGPEVGGPGVRTPPLEPPGGVLPP